MEEANSEQVLIESHFQFHLTSGFPHPSMPAMAQLKHHTLKSANYLELLNKYLLEKGLKKTHQRDVITKIFFSEPHQHFSIENILEASRKEDPSISYATVYRTLMMFVEAGLANQRQFGKGQSLFEQALTAHHDHLICTACGSIVEFEHKDIEKLQDAVAKKNGFRLTHHKMELYGLCPQCQN